MRLCSRHNLSLTIAGIKISKNKILYTNGEWCDGLYCDIITELFTLDKPDYIKKNWPNSCKMIFASEVGKYIPENQTYNGAIGLVANGDADFVFRAFNYFLDSRLVDYSLPIISEIYQPIQFIDKNKFTKNGKLVDFFKFIIPSIEFLILILTSLMVLLLFSISIKYMLKKFSTNQKFRKSVEIKILKFSLVIFMFFISLIFCSNLNTSNVIVDTSDILDTEEKLIQTDKESCFLENSEEINHFRMASTRSLAFKVFEKRNKKDLCYLSTGNFNDPFHNMLKRNPEKIFLICNDLFFELGSKLIKTLLKTDCFLSEHTIHQALRSYVIRKNLKKDIRNFIDRTVNAQMMFGFVMKNLRNIPNYFDFSFVKEGYKKDENEFMTYFGINQYIEDFTKIESLSFDKLEHLFIIYFCFLTLILFIFLVHLNFQRLITFFLIPLSCLSKNRFSFFM